jgi:chorismate mutase
MTPKRSARQALEEYRVLIDALDCGCIVALLNERTAWWRRLAA